jgi:hypothetical protein
MFIYYMTDADYKQHVSSTLSDTPTEGGGFTRPIATNIGWRLLVDEFATPAGQVTVNVEDCAQGQPIRGRFFKIRIGRAWTRLKDDRYRTNIVRIVLSEFKIWSSRRIIQFAELGRTPPFDQAGHIDLMKRLRKRSYLLDKSLYLDTVDKAQEFALQELRERYTEFAPYAVKAVAPGLNLYDTILVTNPETGIAKNYLVMSISHTSDLEAAIEAVDFSIVDNV